MSRSGWSTSNFLRLGSAVVTATPLTIVVWGSTSIAGSVQLLAMIGNSAGVAAFQMFLFTDKVCAGTADEVTSAFASTTTTIALNAPFCACGVWTSSTARAAFLNGAGKGTDATDITPAALDRTSIGVSDKAAPDPSSPFAPAGTGFIGHVGVWKAAITDGEAALIADRRPSPWFRRDSLVGFWRLNGGTNETNERAPASPMVMQGTLGLGVPLPPNLALGRSPSVFGH